MRSHLQTALTAFLAAVFGVCCANAMQPASTIDSPPTNVPRFAQQAIEKWNHPSQENDLSLSMAFHVNEVLQALGAAVSIRLELVPLPSLAEFKRKPATVK